MPTVKCIVCSKRFTPRDIRARCCSKHCGIEHNRERARLRSSNPVVTLQCVECESPFDSSDTRRKYCGRDCAHQGTLKARRELAAVPEWKERHLLVRLAYRIANPGVTEAQRAHERAAKALYYKKRSLLVRAMKELLGEFSCDAVGTDRRAKERAIHRAAVELGVKP